MASVTVTPEDVASRYLEGDLLSEFSEEQVQVQIADAVDFLDSRWLAVINGRLTSGTLSANTYKRIVAKAVLRVMRNPGGVASESEGGYSVSTRATVASGELWFTDGEIFDLTGIALRRSRAAGTVGMALDSGWA